MNRIQLAGELVGLAKSMTAAHSLYTYLMQVIRMHPKESATSLAKTLFYHGDRFVKQEIQNQNLSLNAFAKMIEDIQKHLHVAKSMTAATKDLAEIREILPNLRKKQDEYSRRQEEMRRELAVMWHEAHQDLDTKTAELTAAITRALVAYFKESGKGTRTASDTGTLTEVFLGSDDGVKRYQSKVSAHVVLTFEGRETAIFMLRNENLDDIKGPLSDKNTVDRLLQEVKKAEKDGFWDEPEVE